MKELAVVMMIRAPNESILSFVELRDGCSDCRRRD